MPQISHLLSQISSLTQNLRTKSASPARHKKLSESFHPAIQLSLLLSLGTTVPLANAETIQGKNSTQDNSLKKAVSNSDSEQQQPSPQITNLQQSPATYQVSVGFSNEYQPRTHLVRKGDTITKIAREYKVSSTELVKLNRLKNANIIFVDQQLKIPATVLKSARADLAINPNLSGQFTQARLNPLNQSTVVEQSTPQEISNQRQSDFDSQNKADSTQEDPHIARLRSEIALLRAQYQENGIGSQLSLNQNQTVSRPEVQPLQLQQPEIENRFDLRSDLINEEPIALKLPPLVDSEDYLPEGEVFDGYIWPAKGVFTSGFGWRWGRRHNGVDIAAPIGTAIIAAASGTVVDTGWYGGYGNIVKIEHLDGSTTLYAHLNRILVSNGQKVDQGELVAEMGSTGFSTGSHLHFEIRLSNQQIVNPLSFLPKR